MMKPITIPPLPLHKHNGRANAESGTATAGNDDREPSWTSPPGSPARPPVSPITPVTPRSPNLIGIDGQKAVNQGSEYAAIANDSYFPTVPKPSQIHPKDPPSKSQSQYRQLPKQTQVYQRYEPQSQAVQTLPAQAASVPTPVPVPAPPTTYIPRPPSPVPISTSSNPDAIALRSAISLLQMQRQRGQQDMQALEQIKLAALKDPEAFVSELVAGKLKSGAGGNGDGGGGGGGNAMDDVLSASLRGTQDQHAQQEDEVTPSSSNDGNEAGMIGNGDKKPNDGQDPSRSMFAPVPTPQNIFRCPPINWAKYHVVGEALDRIHAEQIARPPTGDVVAGPGEVGGSNSGNGAQTRDPLYVLSAPYSPFQDRVVAGPGKKGTGRNAGQKGEMGN